MTHPPNSLHARPDARIDQALAALRTASPPAGLEQRIAARIANAAQASSASPRAASLDARLAIILNAPLTVILNAVKDLRIWLAPTIRYALAATSLAGLAALSFFALHTHHPTPTPSQISAAVLPLQPFARNPSTSASLDSAELQPRYHAHTANAARVAEGTDIHLQPGSSQPRTDPDAIALAETLAPSRPAPPEPLTQQELLALAVLRSGDQQEIAALNPTLREANLIIEELAFNKFFAPPHPPTPDATTGDKE